MSSAEAEYVSLSEACKEAMWLRKLLSDFNQIQNKPTILYEDKQSCLNFIKEERLSTYFVKDHVDNGHVLWVYCPTEEMLADMLTKPLAAKHLQNLRSKCGLD